MEHRLSELPGANTGDYAHDRVARELEKHGPNEYVSFPAYVLRNLVREYREDRLALAMQDMYEQEGPDREEVVETFRAVLSHYGVL